MLDYDADAGPTKYFSREGRQTSRYLHSILLLPYFIIHFQFFFSTGGGFETHPLAVPYLQELYIALICASSIIIAIFELSSQVFRFEFYAIPIALGYMIVSAAFGYIAHGQPIFFGFFEERRALFWLSAIPLCYICRRVRLTGYDITSSLVMCSLAYLLTALVVQYGMSDALLARDIGALETRKFRIINGSEVYVIMLLVAPWVFQFSRRVALFGIIFSAAGLFLISQTRSVFAEIVLSELFLVMLLQRRVLIRMLFPFSTFIILIWAGASIFEFDIITWLWNLVPNPEEFASANLSSNVRVNTVVAAIKDLQANEFFGLGALSQQWRQGFLVLYGPNFFITDIGIIGELYRLGWLLFPFLFLMLCFQLKAIENCRTDFARKIALSVFLFYLISAPLNGILWHGGHIFAVVAMYSYCDNWSRHSKIWLNRTV